MNANRLHEAIYKGLISQDESAQTTASELLQLVCEVVVTDFHGLSDLMRNKSHDRDGLQAMHTRLRAKLDYAEATK